MQRFEKVRKMVTFKELAITSFPLQPFTNKGNGREDGKLSLFSGRQVKKQKMRTQPSSTLIAAASYNTLLLNML